MKSRVIFVTLLGCVLLGLFLSWRFTRNEPAKAQIDKAQRPVVTNYVPLKMSLTRDYDASHHEGVLSGDGAFYVSIITSVGPSAGTKKFVLTPNSQDWKALFDACERANLWNLGIEEKFLSEDCYSESYMPNLGWNLSLEYPDRTLTINGWTVALDPSKLDDLGLEVVSSDSVDMTNPYRVDLVDPYRVVLKTIKLKSANVELVSSYEYAGVNEEYYIIISRNLNLASRYQAIQSIWDVIAVHLYKWQGAFRLLHYDE